MAGARAHRRRQHAGLLTGHVPLGGGCLARRVLAPPVAHAHPAPVPDPALAEAIAAIRAGMPARGLHDGPIGVPLGLTPDGVAYYPATYAWHLAELAGHRLPAGRGLVGAVVCLVRGDGAALWQRRAAGLRLGGTWDAAAAGSWRPGEDLAGTALREAVEELGVPASAISAPHATWLVEGPPPRGVTVLLLARIAEGVPLRPAPEEVAEVRWARSGDDLPPPGLWPARRTALGAAGVLVPAEALAGD